MVAPYPAQNPTALAGGINPQMLPLIQAPPAGNFSGNFAQGTAGIRSIAENYAAAFSKDPARRQQYQEQLAIEDAQKQQQLQQLREQQLHFMDQMTELAMNGGFVPSVQRMTQQASGSIDALLGQGTSAQWQQVLQAADLAYKNQPQAGFTLGEGQQRFDAAGNPIASVAPKSDVLSPEALKQKLELAAAGKTAISIDARPVSDTQAKALGYGQRMDAANQIIEGLNYTPTVAGNAISNIPVVGNLLTTEQKQQYDQAKLDFMTANLRKESGAVISEDEFASQDKQYFPQPGDSEKVIKQKAEARQRAVMNTFREGRPVTGEEAKAAQPQASEQPASASSMTDDELINADINTMSDADKKRLDKVLKSKGF